MLMELEEDELTDDDDDDLIDDDDFLLELEDLEENCSLETDDDELSIIGKSNMSSFFCSDCLLFLRINISASNPVIIITTKIIASVEKPLFKIARLVLSSMLIFNNHISFHLNIQMLWTSTQACKKKFFEYTYEL